MNHASIVPLIGGMTLAAKNVSGVNPEFIISWNAFNSNEQHLTNYLGPSVPRYLVDESGFTDDLKRRLNETGDIDLVTALCPCAGLSRLNRSRNPLTFGSTAGQNQWMYNSANLVLSQIKPKVLMGENAPGLLQNKGEGTLQELRAIALRQGYSFSTVMTNSMVHGLPQNRQRSFYFFWKSPTAPVMEWVNGVVMKGYGDIIREAATGSLHKNDYVRPQKASERDPAYRYILNEFGVEHAEFATKHVKPNVHFATFDFIIENGLTQKCVDWTMANLDKFPETGMKYLNMLTLGQRKIDMHMGYYNYGSVIVNPEGKHNAFVGKLLFNLTNPFEDRYLNVREMITVMRLPLDFELVDWKKNVNHICQNVPLTTAEYFVGQASKFINGELALSNDRINNFNYLKKSYYSHPESIQGIFQD